MLNTFDIITLRKIAWGGDKQTDKHTDKHTDKRTSRLIDWIGLGADSVKKKYQAF